MSTASMTWWAAGLALAAVVVLVVVDRQAARRRRRPLGSALRRSPSPAAATPAPSAAPRTGPMLVRLDRPTSLWRRIRAVVGIGAVSLAAGFTLAIAAAVFLFLAAFLLRQAVG